MLKIEQLTNEQKAVLVVFEICCYPDVPQKVHNRFAKMLGSIKVDGLVNLGACRFIVKSDLYNHCKAWKEDPIINHKKNLIMESFGN